MDYSAQSPLTCLATFHNGSSCLSITQREAEREEDKRGDGFNLWEGIKPSVAWLWRHRGAKVRDRQLSCQKLQLPPSVLVTQ